MRRRRRRRESLLLGSPYSVSAVAVASPYNSLLPASLFFQSPFGAGTDIKAELSYVSVLDYHDYICQEGARDVSKEREIMERRTMIIFGAWLSKSGDEWHVFFLVRRRSSSKRLLMSTAN